MDRTHARSALALVGASLLSSCDSSPSPSNLPTDPAEPAGAARVAGTARDSAGAPLGRARIHVYEGGNDSVASRIDSCGADGSFRLDLHPGRARLFFDKDGRIANAVDFAELRSGQVTRLDSLRLRGVLDGSFQIPGIANLSSFSVKVLGSPLDASVSTTGRISVKVVYGQESILVLTFSANGGTVTLRFRVRAADGNLSISPISDTADVRPTTVPASGALEIHPGPDQVDDCGIIGNFEGTSSHQTTNYGTRQDEGLGGAWDGNTIGRELWRYAFPDSLRGRVISAKLVFTPLHWGIRPQHGQDMTIEGFRMLRPWKEGAGLPDGSTVSTGLDGVDAIGPAYGQRWNRPLVGLDGVDAESVPVTRATLPDQSLQPIVFDITTAVQLWLEHPETNRGLLFRNIHESDGLYLDYAGVASDDHPDPTKRPYLVLELAPASSDTSAKLVVVRPASGVQADAAIIGTFTGSGSHDGDNQGLRTWESLGGSWDYNTIGRLLWRIPVPDSLAGRTILSATAVFKVAQYCGRPLRGHDYRVEAYRMKRSWTQGAGDFPGVPNSATIDGATSLGPAFGSSWRAPLVALDGSDADADPSARSLLKYGDTTSMSFDFTSLVRGWIANPSSNFGVVFRSMEEVDASFPDYPGFWMSDATDPSVRPELVIRYR